MKGLAGTEIAANTIIDMMKEQGMSYRRQDMLSDLRGFRRFYANQANVARLGADKPIPRSWGYETEWSLAGKFRYEFKADFRDPVTGAVYSEPVSMSSDRWLSKGELEEEFEQTAPWEDYDYQLQPGTLRLLGMAYRPDAWPD